MAHFRGGVVVVRQVGPGVAAPLVPSPRSQTESWAWSHGGPLCREGVKREGTEKSFNSNIESHNPPS